MMAAEKADLAALKAERGGRKQKGVNRGRPRRRTAPNSTGS